MKHFINARTVRRFNNVSVKPYKVYPSTEVKLFDTEDDARIFCNEMNEAYKSSYVTFEYGGVYRGE